MCNAARFSIPPQRMLAQASAVVLVFAAWGANVCIHFMLRSVHTLRGKGFYSNHHQPPWLLATASPPPSGDLNESSSRPTGDSEVTRRSTPKPEKEDQPETRPTRFVSAQCMLPPAKGLTPLPARGLVRGRWLRRLRQVGKFHHQCQPHSVASWFLHCLCVLHFAQLGRCVSRVTTLSVLTVG